jgi:hypothetical protein
MGRARAYVGAAGLAALVLAGCGSGTTAPDTVTVTTTAPAPATTAVTHGRDATHRKRRVHRSRTVSAGRKACDANISVKIGTTSCAFGENVFYGFWKAQDQGDDAFEAYSPVTKRSYGMACTTGTTVVCRADDGGEVRFPKAAVDAYDNGQAARYAATHDTGPAGDVPVAPDAGGAGSTEGSSSEGGDCDPSYEGACLDPNAIDYDCEDGSGDGPEYTGTVDVVGDDHYDLDRDGDGVGCD